jgi:restriction system protein
MRVTLDDWSKERYEKTGYVRWVSVLHLYSIDCVKAGFLVKKKGVWYLTPDGDQALGKGKAEFFDLARAGYKAWRKTRAPVGESGDVEELVGEESVTESLTLEQAEQSAREGLESYVNTRNPYEFQDLAAALLRAMGYFTPFVAPKGKDGGLDVTAYRDPLGSQSPRIKVQVKHRSGSATAQEIRQLRGLLQKDGDVGIFVSSGGFTADAKAEARMSNVHVELIDLARFLALWIDFHPKMNDEDRARLRLTPVYFLAEVP